MLMYSRLTLASTQHGVRPMIKCSVINMATLYSQHATEEEEVIKTNGMARHQISPLKAL